jgi:V/A-type H+-transporting ATPase subunit C
MRSALATYGFLSAKLKTRISMIMSPAALDSLIRARSLPEAVLLLRDTVHAPIEAAFSATGDLLAGEAIVNARELALYTGLFRYLQDPILAFVRALSLRFEVEKLKQALRVWFDARVRNRAVQGSSGYIHRPRIVHDFDVDAIIHAADADALDAALAATPYQSIVRGLIPQVLAGQSIFRLEVALDHYYYAQVFRAATGLTAPDRSIAERMLGMDVDLQNLSWLVRFRTFHKMPVDEAMAYLIPQGKAIDRAAITAAWADGRSIAASGLEGIMRRYGGIGALFGSFLGDGVSPGGSASPGGAVDAARAYSADARLDTANRLAYVESAVRQIRQADARRSLGGHPFSIGIVLAYFTLEREELRLVMTILNAKHYSLSEDRIRSVL